MLNKTFLAVAFVSLNLFCAVTNLLGAASSPGVALTGQVSSQEEARMEGVLVSAKREGSTVTTTVVTNAQGRYSFPSTRLDRGVTRSVFAPSVMSWRVHRRPRSAGKNRPHSI